MSVQSNQPINKWQKTISVLVSKRCDPECIEFFMPHVENLNFGVNQENPLLSSLWSDETTNPDLVKYLISKGADPNTKSSQGSTPIHFAAQQGNLDLVKWLAANGADLFMVTNSGQDILYFAKQCQAQVPEMAQFARDLMKSPKEVVDENEKLKKQNEELASELKKFQEAFAGQEALKRVLCTGNSEGSCSK